jgi:hypothetical protein
MMKATSTEPSMEPRLAGLARFVIGRPSLMALALICWLWTGCSKSNLHVVSAVYGMGTNYVDVSSRVNDLLEQAPVFDARPETMQGDPDPGWHKTLVIVYEVKGHRHIFTAKEDDSVGATILLEAARH